MQESLTSLPLPLINHAHSLIEKQLFVSRQTRDNEGLLEQKRLLLADLACHLAQDALEKGELNTDSLKNHLYAILTICDAFLPEQGLKQKANTLLTE